MVGNVRLYVGTEHQNQSNYYGVLGYLGYHILRGTLIHMCWLYGHDLFSSYDEIYKSDTDIQENLGP